VFPSFNIVKELYDTKEAAANYARQTEELVYQQSIDDVISLFFFFFSLSLSFNVSDNNLMKGLVHAKCANSDQRIEGTEPKV
jgi:hypothetical protein